MLDVEPSAGTCVKERIAESSVLGSEATWRTYIEKLMFTYWHRLSGIGACGRGGGGLDYIGAISFTLRT